MKNLLDFYEVWTDIKVEDLSDVQLENLEGCLCSGILEIRKEKEFRNINNNRQIFDNVSIEPSGDRLNCLSANIYISDELIKSDKEKVKDMIYKQLHNSIRAKIDSILQVTKSN